MGNIDNLSDFCRACYLGSKFLVCGGEMADLPYERVRVVREKNRKIGLGLMGVHEWLLRKGHRYEMNEELEAWLDRGYVKGGEAGANEISDDMGINRPNRYRAIAPTGTIGIMASTTTGIEPLYAVAYKRRYLTNGDQWNYEYVIDSTAEMLIQQYDLDPDDIETAASLANDPERRIKFQYEVQKYVDMGISSTINLPPFNEQKFTPEAFSLILLRYANGLRGLTVYPDGARGGQPLTVVPYAEAKSKTGKVYKELELECDT